MKSTMLVFVLIASLLTISATDAIHRGGKKRFKAPKGYVYVPSGKMEVNNTDISIQGFYISSGEVTNKQYNTFLEDLKTQNRIDDYELAKIKNDQWLTIGGSLEPFANLYHMHPAYDDYPVVNISKEGAKLYCQWKNDQFKNSKYSKKFHINFRLPQEVEWVYAAMGGNDDAEYGWSSNDTKNKNGKYYGNFKHDTQSGVVFTTPSYAYPPNDYGIYNLSGNVAEYTATTGSIKGGAWNDNLEALKIYNKNDYPEKASPYIGFRPVITVVMKN